MYLDYGFINLSEDTHKNILEHEGQYFALEYLKEDGKIVKGGNGVVFKLVNEQTSEEFVIKISQFPESKRYKSKIRKRIARFEREIEALYVAKNNYLENIVLLNFDGYINIEDEVFRFYVMQKCDCTLTEYLSDPSNDLTVIQKVFLCKKILIGIIGLHEYKIYHRDIKNDNILFINGEPIIADLGLSDYRDSDIWINEKGDLIGPTGWFSPEAINKYLVEKNANLLKIDCIIDEKSEVFQLGKLFWYIMQGNLPLGQVMSEDFILNDEPLFNILFCMLEYSKERRSSTNESLEDLEKYIGNN